MARNLEARIARLEKKYKAIIEEKRNFLNLTCGAALIVHATEGIEIRDLLGPIVYDYFLNVYQKSTRTTSVEEWLLVEENFIETSVRYELFKQMLERETDLRMGQTGSEPCPGKRIKTATNGVCTSTTRKV